MKQDAKRDAWLLGFATALASVHALLINAGKDAGLCSLADGAGLTLAEARRVGLTPYDVERLRKAGLR